MIIRTHYIHTYKNTYAYIGARINIKANLNTYPYEPYMEVHAKVYLVTTRNLLSKSLTLNPIPTPNSQNLDFKPQKP